MLINIRPADVDTHLYVGATRAATYLGMTCVGPSLPERLAPLGALLEADWRAS